MQAHTRHRQYVRTVSLLLCFYFPGFYIFLILYILYILILYIPYIRYTLFVHILMFCSPVICFPLQGRTRKKEKRGAFFSVPYINAHPLQNLVWQQDPIFLFLYSLSVSSILLIGYIPYIPILDTYHQNSGDGLQFFYSLYTALYFFDDSCIHTLNYHNQLLLLYIQKYSMRYIYYTERFHILPGLVLRNKPVLFFRILFYCNYNIPICYYSVQTYMTKSFGTAFR